MSGFSTFNGGSCVPSVLFNTDNSQVTLVTTSSFSTFSCESSPLRCLALENSLGGMKIALPIYHSPVLVLVSSGDTPGTSPRRLRFWNFITRETLREHSFDSTVTCCAANKTLLVVGTCGAISLFEISTMSLIFKLHCPGSTRHIFSLSSGTDSFLAYSGTGCAPCIGNNISGGGDSTHIGEVVVLDCTQLRVVSRISAHKSAVAALVFSCQGDMIASASITGSLIRVFSAPDGVSLFELRHSIPSPMHLLSFLSQGQGETEAALQAGMSISSLSFCPEGRYLLSASADASRSRKGFINIFRLNSRPPQSSDNRPLNTLSQNGEDDDFGFLKVDAADAPSPHQLSVNQPEETTEPSQGWQQRLTSSAALQLLRLKELSQEYVAAAVAAGTGAGSRLKPGLSPALTAHIHPSISEELTQPMPAQLPDDLAAASLDYEGRLFSEMAETDFVVGETASSGHRAEGDPSFLAMLNYSAPGGRLALCVVSTCNYVFRRYCTYVLSIVLILLFNKTIGLFSCRYNLAFLEDTSQQGDATLTLSDSHPPDPAGAPTAVRGPQTLSEVLHEERLMLES